MAFGRKQTDAEVMGDFEAYYHQAPDDDDYERQEQRRRRLDDLIDEAWDESVIHRLNRNGMLEVCE